MKTNFFKKSTRTAALILASLLLASSLVSGAATSDAPIIEITPGDINDDGIINSKDIISLKNYINDPTTEKKINYDVNNDGVVNAKDLNRLAAHINTLKTQSQAIAYYVKDGNGTLINTYYSMDEAKKAVDDNWLRYGYAVYDHKYSGDMVYSYGTKIQNKILYGAKWVADTIKAENYCYGDARINPPFASYEDGYQPRISCDRFVDWAIYKAGFTNQPSDNGGWVVWDANNPNKDLTTQLANLGFTKITNMSELQPGDVVFVKYTLSRPEHTFIHAGIDKNGNYWRYDAGSENRIRCANQSSTTLPGATLGGNYTAYATTGQPFKEGIPSNQFLYAMRAPQK